MGEQVPWPPPPRDPGPWGGGPPVSPPGNTPLPPLPGAGGVVHGGPAAHNPFAGPTVSPSIAIPPDRPVDGPAPPAAGSPRPQRDRAPRWVLILAALIVAAMIAGAAYVLLEGGRSYPSAWDPRVETIADWVAKERDLDFEHPVQVNFLAPDEYREVATAGGDVATDEDEQAQDDQVAFLRALGFISGEVDLDAAVDTLSDSGTLAFYDPEVEEVYVRGTELTPALRVTLAHELVHVLQDQNFDLERVGDDDPRSSVLRALAEGDATLVEEAFVDEVLTDEERKAYEEETSAAADDAQAELDESVPPVLTTVFASPYILGPELIAFLDQRDGWTAIDRALEEPPTEEVLFDPPLWETDEAKPLTASASAPDDAEVLDRGEFGPTTWYLLLASRMDAKVALAAVDGWGGDEYVTYRQDDRVCVAVTAKGDTDADTDELGAAAGAWSAESPEGTASSEVRDGTVRFRSCDPGKDADAVSDEVTPQMLALPVTRTQVYRSILDAGLTEDQARCYSKGVIDTFSTDELFDPSGEAVSTPEGQRTLAGILRECGA